MIRSVRSLQDAEDALREIDSEINRLKHTILPISALPKLNVTIILPSLTSKGQRGRLQIKKGIVVSFKQPT